MQGGAHRSVQDMFTFATSVTAQAGKLVQGYGTIKFKSEADVQRAIADFNGYELEGRNLTVKVDQYA